MGNVSVFYSEVMQAKALLDGLEEGFTWFVEAQPHKISLSGLDAVRLRKVKVRKTASGLVGGTVNQHVVSP
jgi:hypothetical protein